MPTPPRLDVNLVLETMSVSASFSLSPLERWLENLRHRNEISRSRDEGYIFVRTHCPHCGACAVFLTSLDIEDGRVRACRLCGEHFPPT